MSIIYIYIGGLRSEDCDEDSFQQISSHLYTQQLSDINKHQLHSQVYANQIRKLTQSRQQVQLSYNTSKEQVFKRQRRSFEIRNTHKKTEPTPESVTSNTVIKPQGELREKMAYLCHFVRKKSKEEQQELEKLEDEVPFRNEVERQIQKDCNAYLNRIRNRNQIRSIIKKRHPKEDDLFFILPRSTTF